MNYILKILLTLFLNVCCAFSMYAQHFESSAEFAALKGIGDISNTTFGLSMINGYRFNNYLYSGIGVGLNSSNSLYRVHKREGNKVEHEKHG
jgi:hypothetical protein